MSYNLLLPLNAYPGTKALYRNKIDSVAKFLEDMYSDERNIDYNLCSEMEYDHRKFHGNVKRFEVRRVSLRLLSLFIMNSDR